MKKGIIASLVALTSGAAIAAFALRGPDKLVDLRVNADTDDYSITFDASDTVNTTVENPYGHGNYAICRTTARGNKLGVAGPSVGIPELDRLHFGEANFYELDLHDESNALINAGANDFDHITGYMITFSGGSLFFRTGLGHEGGSSVTSGVKYDVSLTPDDYPAFAMDEHSEDTITIDSLTIWYSC